MSVFPIVYKVCIPPNFKTREDAEQVAKDLATFGLEVSVIPVHLPPSDLEAEIE
jgi:hypothetical protein